MRYSVSLLTRGLSPLSVLHLNEKRYRNGGIAEMKYELLAKPTRYQSINLP
jgi:hypothetical protein